MLSVVEASIEEEVIVSKDDHSDEFCEISSNSQGIKGDGRAIQSQEISRNSENTYNWHLNQEWQLILECRIQQRT